MKYIFATVLILAMCGMAWGGDDLTFFTGGSMTITHGIAPQRSIFPTTVIVGGGHHINENLRVPADDGTIHLFKPVVVCGGGWVGTDKELRAGAVLVATGQVIYYEPTKEEIYRYDLKELCGLQWQHMGVEK